MTKHLLLGLLIFFSLGIITCERYIIEFPEIDETIKVDFLTEVLPIFDNDCKLCHSGGQVPNLTTGNAFNSILEGNYVDTINPESSELYSILLPSGTHNGKTTQGNMDIILVWISQGAHYSIDDGEPPVEVELISFWNQVVPVFEANNCTDCHNTGQTPPDLSSFNAYSSLSDNNLLDTINPENSGLYALSGFHKDKLNDAERDTILMWIDQGAIDDTPPKVVSFSQHLQPIFDTQCIVCHASGSFLDLTSGAAYNVLTTGSYVDPSDPESSPLYKTFIGDGSHVGRTTEYNVQLFLSWIEDGALDN